MGVGHLRVDARRSGGGEPSDEPFGLEPRQGVGGRCEFAAEGEDALKGAFTTSKALVLQHIPGTLAGSTLKKYATSAAEDAGEGAPVSVDGIGDGAFIIEGSSMSTILVADGTSVIDITIKGFDDSAAVLSDLAKLALEHT